MCLLLIKSSDRNLNRAEKPHRLCMSTVIREFKITTTAKATGTSLNKRFNAQNNGSARAL